MIRSITECIVPEYLQKTSFCTPGKVVMRIVVLEVHKETLSTKPTQGQRDGPKTNVDSCRMCMMDEFS